MAFPENLQYIRSQAGVTQEQLAEQLEVTRQSVSKWEGGLRGSGSGAGTLENRLVGFCCGGHPLRRDCHCSESLRQGLTERAGCARISTAV